MATLEIEELRRKMVYQYWLMCCLSVSVAIISNLTKSQTLSRSFIPYSLIRSNLVSPRSRSREAGLDPAREALAGRKLQTIRFLDFRHDSRGRDLSTRSYGEHDGECAQEASFVNYLGKGFPSPALLSTSSWFLGQNPSAKPQAAKNKPSIRQSQHRSTPKKFRSPGPESVSVSHSRSAKSSLAAMISAHNI